MKEKVISVFDFVENMRENRINMVQTSVSIMYNQMFTSFESEGKSFVLHKYYCGSERQSLCGDFQIT